ncbi:Crp/Fnr family transcriptional regulator [Panacibacter sp. DH6]|uniref:Crp/Fnr family transcriptional regulator n=1 Tax=Panacibacter microcysteis TaxID=2793269 RepID=A0A931E5U4_9BACT|nr:Crp/Fnr family transcriptional regulator [Panacibacter microcysteis]MBG9377598.1 Crp/Fnr family transcriptional regulator [Panacibacter microcysteis]
MKSSATHEQLHTLRKVMDKIEPVNDDDFNLLIPFIKREKFKRGQVIVHEGTINRYVYFIIKGCVRSHGIEEGREVNLKFYFEENVFADFNSLKNETASAFSFVALESVEVLCISKTDVLPLVLHSDGMTLFSFRFFEQLFIEEELHSNSFKLLTPEQRYHYLEENEPHYLQRIPLTYLASYLGTSRETLNRIRRSK